VTARKGKTKEDFISCALYLLAKVKQPRYRPRVANRVAGS